MALIVIGGIIGGLIGGGSETTEPPPDVIPSPTNPGKLPPEDLLDPTPAEPVNPGSDRLNQSRDMSQNSSVVLNSSNSKYDINAHKQYYHDPEQAQEEKENDMQWYIAIGIAALLPIIAILKR